MALQSSTLSRRLLQLSQVGMGVKYLNLTCGVCHRDLKTDNVMIDEHGSAKITDYGTARSIGINQRNEDAGHAPGAIDDEYEVVPVCKDLAGMKFLLVAAPLHIIDVNGNQHRFEHTTHPQHTTIAPLLTLNLILTLPSPLPEHAFCFEKPEGERELVLLPTTMWDR